MSIILGGVREDLTRNDICVDVREANRATLSSEKHVGESARKPI